MEEMTLAEVLEKAKLWQAQEKSWHFHVLAPDCVFNERRDQYALVLENRTDNQTYVLYGADNYAQVSQVLVKMLHGESILDKNKGTTSSGHEKMRTILQKAQEFNREHVPWHHHMLFPDCIFNKHQGWWNIVFEDKDKGEVSEVLYDQEPVDDLRSIELLYFEQTYPSA